VRVDDALGAEDDCYDDEDEDVGASESVATGDVTQPKRLSMGEKGIETPDHSAILKLSVIFDLAWASRQPHQFPRVRQCSDVRFPSLALSLTHHDLQSPLPPLRVAFKSSSWYNFPRQHS